MTQSILRRLLEKLNSRYEESNQRQVAILVAVMPSPGPEIRLLGVPTFIAR
jgi:hypothetical protein